MPFFTIIIPTYNREEKLKATIQSVLHQTYTDFELLVMDDGSTDNTEKMVNNFSDDRIRYYWASNSGGPATPRNRGIDLANAPWISFLDADDIWYPTRLFEVAEAIICHPECDVFCHYEMLNVIGTNKKTLLKYGPYEPDFYRLMLIQGNRLSTSAVTVRKEFLLAHQLRFNQSCDYVIVEDYDLWLRLAIENALFFFITKALGEYIIENDNISLASGTTQKNQKVLLKDHVYKIQKFEPDKDKLWDDILLRLDIKQVRDLLAKGHVFKGLHLLFVTTYSRPVQVIKIITSLFRNLLFKHA
jgi:glycosyltransferase involved in cell wall biosynthesis